MTLSDCVQGSLVSQWRVLIVENDPKQRADQVENLRGWGYEVFVAEVQMDAEDAYLSLRSDAIQKARAHCCHVVLVDQRLRSDASPDDISGVELANELAPLHSVVLSGYKRSSSLEQVTARWCYVGKEDGPEALKLAIEATIERIQAQTSISVSGDQSSYWGVNHDNERLTWYFAHPGCGERSATARGFVENLKAWPYEYYCAEAPTGAEDAHKALLEDATQKAHAHRCHIALVDMRLRDDSDPSDISGLALVKQLAPTVSIILSGYGDKKTVREALNPKNKVDVPLRAYDFIGKEDGPEALKQVIEEVSSRLWSRRKSFGPTG